MAQLQQLFRCEEALCLGLLNQPQDLPRLALPPHQVQLLQNTYFLMKGQLQKLACSIGALCLGLLNELYCLPILCCLSPGPGPAKSAVHLIRT